MNSVTSNHGAGPVVIRPAPAQPDLKEYAHLSEKQRMLGSYPYVPLDPELTKEREIARDICRKFNNSEPTDMAKRQQLLKQLMPNADDDIYIEPNFRVDYGINIKMGKGAQINFDCCILDCAQITIGKNCFMAPNVHIYGATHPLCGEQRLHFELARPVTIGDNVWIGGQSVICPGVTIGDDVTVGAGSVVTKNVPSHVVVAGNPAKIIRYLPGYLEN